jgi:hypothetical protein
MNSRVDLQMQTNIKADSFESTLMLIIFLTIALNGGGDRTRTRYLLLAKQPLSQLSYTPI